MQRPIFFDHQIVQPDDMTFLVDSTESSINQNLSLFTGQNPGIVQGLVLGGTPGLTNFTVSQGYGYDASGERLEIFPTTGLSFGISFTGTQPIYARLGTPINYNPNPVENPLGAFGVIQSLDPDTGQLIDVQSFNNVVIDNLGTSGVDIFLGTVDASASGKFVSKDTTNAQNLLFIGAFDLNTKTINGGIIATGTIDSTRFTHPLTAEIFLGTGANITPDASGVNSLGTIANPFSGIFVKDITTHQIHGMSPIIVDTLSLVAGESIETQSGRVLIDTNARGTQFGSTIYSTGLRTAGFNNLTLSTPSGDIILQSTSGSVNLQNATNVGSLTNKQNLTVYGKLIANSGLTVTGTANFVGADIVISQNDFNPKNLLSNSDFSMGLPTLFTGATMFTGILAASNFRSGLAIFSPYEPRYQNILSPYNWTASGISPYSLICGSAQDAPETVGINEVQTITITSTGVIPSGYIPNSGTLRIGFSGMIPNGLITGPATNFIDIPITGTAPSAAEIQSAMITGMTTIGGAGLNLQNILVSSAVNGGGFLQYTFQFQNGLGSLNVSGISASGTGTNASRQWTVTQPPMTVTQGYTPIPSGNVIKDTTAFTAVGQATYARLSGITSQANPLVMFAPLNSMSLNETYNVSFYDKITSDPTNLEYWAAIVPSTGTIGGFTKVSSYTKPSWVVQGGTWNRRSANVTTNNFYDQFYVAILIQPTGTGPALPVVANIGGVQVTKGPNLFGYSNNDPTIFRMAEPSGVLSPVSIAGGLNSLGINWLGNQLSDPNVVDYRWSTVSTTVGSAIPIVSGSFYSPGAMFKISAEATFYLGGDMRSMFSLNLDGKQLKSRYVRAFNEIWGVNNEYIGYVPKGSHGLTMTMTPGYAAGSTMYVYQGAKQIPSNSNNIDGWMPDPPRIDIVMFQ